jgi:hypothetical protein
MRCRVPDSAGDIVETDIDNPIACFLAIGRWLSCHAPQPWLSIAVKFTIFVIDDVSEEVISYVPEKHQGERLQFFIDDTGFADCFFALAKLTSKPPASYFQTCTYVLNADGTYNADFVYQ